MRDLLKYKAGKLDSQDYLQKVEEKMNKLKKYAEAGRELGERLIKRNRTQQDLVDACRFLMKAAADGDCECQAKIAQYYERGMGLPKSDKM
eukprot:766328-Hanusia_phi.AAC.17